MKALSLLQPWASLVAISAKSWETRSWQTSYRGPIAIHASKGFSKDLRDLCYTAPFFGVLCAHADLAKQPQAQALPRASIIAVADLTDIITSEEWVRCYESPSIRFPHSTLELSRSERAFGDYSPNRFAWKLENVRRLRAPVPCRGSLSIWQVPDDVAAEVERSLAT